MYEEGSVASHSRGRILSFSPQTPQQRRKKNRMSKDSSEGTSNWCIGISFAFFRQMVRVNAGNDEYIT